MAVKHRGLSGFRNCFESHLSVSKIRYVMGRSQGTICMWARAIVNGFFPCFPAGSCALSYPTRSWRASVSLTALAFSLERSSASAEVSCSELLVTKLTKFFLLCQTNQHPDLWGACFSGTVCTCVLQALDNPYILRLDAALEFFLLKAGGGWYFCCPAAMAANGYSCMVCWLISALSLQRKNLILVILIAFHEIRVTLIYTAEVHEWRNDS